MTGPVRTLPVFAASLGAWLLLSGKFDAFHIGWGVAGSLVLALMAGRWLGESRFPLLRMARFVPWLLWQILLSNIRVARLVLRPNLPIKPRLLRRPPANSGDQALTVLGCAITLTPGTLTVDIDGDAMIVHAIDDASYQDMQKNIMADRVGEIFREVRS